MFVCIHLYVFKINSYACQIKGNHTKLPFCQISLTLPYDTFWKFINLFSWLQKAFSQQLPLKSPNYQRGCYNLSKKIHIYQSKSCQKDPSVLSFSDQCYISYKQQSFFLLCKTIDWSPYVWFLWTGLYDLNYFFRTA